MAKKSFAEMRAESLEASQEASSGILTKLAGSGKKYKASMALEDFDKATQVEIMVFGEQGTGKTYLIVQLLKAGLKVFGIMTDFGKSGFLTVRNYFKEHPEEAYLQANFAKWVTPDEESAEALMNFCRDPGCVEIEHQGKDINIYDFDPDVIFWDGGSAWQQVDLEGKICAGDEFLREDSGFKDWRSTMNGTLFTMERFLKLKSRSGKPWSKIVTFLEDKQYEKEKTGEVDNKGVPKTQMVKGTNKSGPLLHTGVRKLAGAGFSICLESSKQEFNKTSYILTSNHSEKLVKDRGFNLPETMNITNDNFWLKYIAPKIGGKETISLPSSS